MLKRPGLFNFAIMFYVAYSCVSNLIAQCWKRKTHALLDVKKKIPGGLMPLYCCIVTVEYEI